MKIDWTKHETTTGGDSKSVTFNPAYPLGATVDVVEVVRCGDCEYYVVETNGGIGTCELTISGAKDDGFCAWGERKEDAID